MKRNFFELIDDKTTDYSYYQIQGFFVNDKPGYFKKKLAYYASLINKKCLYMKKGETNRIKVFCRQFFLFRFSILLPDSVGKIIWDSFILLLLCINLLYIPVKISFSQIATYKNPYLLTFFDDFPSWAFILDIILNFNTAYYSKG